MKAWAVWATLAIAGAATAQTVPSYVTRALADPARADQKGDDERRHAAAAIAFSGVKPGATVVDYLPGRGYWTRIFTGVVGPKGRVYALWPSTADTERGRAARDAVAAFGLANVTARISPTPLPSADTPVDLFWTVQNYHDIPNSGRGEAALTAFNQAVYRMLKPGGTYVVIDHVAPAGSGLSATETTHRIDPAVVKRQVTAAGFRFEGESAVLANPADDHSKGVFDPSIRGRTDQFIYKFRKPK